MTMIMIFLIIMMIPLQKSCQIQILEGHRNVVSCLAKSHNGAYVASGRSLYYNNITCLDTSRWWLDASCLCYITFVFGIFLHFSTISDQGTQGRRRALFLFGRSPLESQCSGRFVIVVVVVVLEFQNPQIKFSAWSCWSWGGSVYSSWQVQI